MVPDFQQVGADVSAGRHETLDALLRVSFQER